MKTIFLSTALALVAGYSKAQISQSQFFPGNPKRGIELNAGTFSTATGSNQTWDFSTWTPNGSEYRLSFKNAGTSFPQFPGATLALELDSDSGSAHQVMALRNGRLEQIGLTYTKDGQTISIPYGNPKLLFPAQFQLGQQFSDDYQSFNDLSQGGGFSAFIRTGGTTELHVDASGTLLVPGQTYTNALRVVTRDFQLDTMYLDLGGIFGSDTTVTEMRTTTYNWYVNDGTGFPLAFSIVIDSSFSDGTWESDTTAFYALNTTASVSDQQNPGNPVLAYPSHVEDVLHITLPAGEGAPETLEVLDIQGRVAGTFQVRKDGPDSIETDLSGLPPGKYHIREFSKLRKVKKVLFFVKL